MIVIEESGGRLLLVRQPDHAAASAAMARAWHRPDALSAPIWLRFIDAVRRHDDGWIEAERCPMLDRSGRPLDFKTIPTPHHVAVWRRTIELTGHDDVYAMLLIAHHARWLYTSVGQQHVEDQHVAHRFTDELGMRIDEATTRLSNGSAQERAAVQPGAVTLARRLLAFSDMLSLVLLGALGPPGPSEPLMFGSSLAEVRIGLGDGTLWLDPWPFAGAGWQLTTTARRLEQTRFGDSEDLARRMAECRPVVLRWSIRAGPGR